jgi:hypothetical protein
MLPKSCRFFGGSGDRAQAERLAIRKRSQTNVSK